MTTDKPSERALEVAREALLWLKGLPRPTNPHAAELEDRVARALDRFAAEERETEKLAWKRTCDQVLTGLLYRASRGDISSEDVREAMEQLGTGTVPVACCAAAREAENRACEALAEARASQARMSGQWREAADIRLAIAARREGGKGR